MNEFFLTLLYFTLIHCCLYFFDTIFRSCSHLPYLYFLKNTGLTIFPFRIVWFTTAFNRLIQKWGSVRKRWQLAWFTTGTWFTVVLLPIALWIILQSLFQVLKLIVKEERHELNSGAFLEPVVPGITLPLSDLGYYMVTMVVTSGFHEIGHAISAVREDVHISGVGVVLVFIVPMAYVEMEQMELLPPLKQLRIVCAGVWHNVVLAFAAALVVVLLPYVFYPLYGYGSGVQVQFIEKDSPLLGPAGLSVKDKIVKLNQCQVLSKSDWQDCLIHIIREPLPGFCIHSEFIKEHDESVHAKHLADGSIECCSGNSNRHLCFEYLETETEPLELPQHSCLNARSVVEMSADMCHRSNSGGGLGVECPFGYHCFRPSLGNITKLVLIVRSLGKEVLFLGHPADIYHTVHVSDFVSVYSAISSSIPDTITRLCQYLTIISSGLAIINTIPCFKFDGYYIIKVLMDIFLAKRIQHSSVRHAIALSITIFGTSVIILYLTITLWLMLF